MHKLKACLWLDMCDIGTLEDRNIAISKYPIFFFKMSNKNFPAVALARVKYESFDSSLPKQRVSYHVILCRILLICQSCALRV